MGGQNYIENLLFDVHKGTVVPDDAINVAIVKGSYKYFHYGCDGFDDRGWGCGYRTLMTLCSWIEDQLKKDGRKVASVPSHHEIQRLLCRIGDKDCTFVGSKEWIGSVEVSYVIDELYDVPSRLIHMASGSEASSVISELYDHFDSGYGPIMMGGNIDCSAKGVMGICGSSSKSYLLIVDPHFWGIATAPKVLQDQYLVKWFPISELLEGSFYNLCLPQVKYHEYNET